jgi:hypothetical protein
LKASKDYTDKKVAEQEYIQEHIREHAPDD